MKILTDISTTKNTLRQTKGTIGFVPTMGALHDGHISLIKQAKQENDIVVVSIFVNPTQFLEGEDLDRYPRTYEADKAICQSCGVDFVFMPDIKTMYEDDEILIKAPKIKGFVLEGEKRAGHFDGVLQVVLKLFNIIKPTKSYFGKKDAQQLILIKQMVKNLYLDIDIVECEIIREDDGLALSSRNIYLNHTQRTQALTISKALFEACSLFLDDKITDALAIKQHIHNILSTQKDIQIEYIQITNKNLELIETLKQNDSIILIAVKLGTIRLIDNIWL
jgi:pantoate--beta-alanine ligase